MTNLDHIDNNDYDPFYMVDADIYFQDFYSIAVINDRYSFRVILDVKSRASDFGDFSSNLKLVTCRVKNEDILEYELDIESEFSIKGIYYSIFSIGYDEFGVSTLVLNKKGQEDERYEGDEI